MTIDELERETTSHPDLHASNTMKALVYHGPGKPSWGRVRMFYKRLSLLSQAFSIW